MTSKIEIIGDITLNLEYWDCECIQNYIHPISIEYCKYCNTHQDDAPSSREEEVNESLLII